MAAKSAKFAILHAFPDNFKHGGPKTAVTEKPHNHDQPTIITCSNSCGKTLFECAHENLSPTPHNSNYGSPGLRRFCGTLFPHCLELLLQVRADIGQIHASKPIYERSTYPGTPCMLSGKHAPSPEVTKQLPGHHTHVDGLERELHATAMDALRSVHALRAYNS